MDKESERNKLLLRMYDQLFNDINRHIVVIWQSIVVVVGSFSIFALIEKDIISLDIAISLIILLCFWLLAHLHDAGYWYNRNLAMIANIERQFLKNTDLREIHYYFGKHRPKNRMLTHLKIQYALGTTIIFLVTLYHFIKNIVPGFKSSLYNIELIRTLPYIILMISVIYLCYLRKNRIKSYEEFLKNSPGKVVNTKGINYGVGHGFRKKRLFN